MQVTPESLAEHYRALRKSELIELYRHGGLTEVAIQVLRQELEHRGVDLASLIAPGAIPLEVEVELDCQLCGHRYSRLFQLKASRWVGVDDLDGRPRDDSREKSLQALTRCPRCGYCSPAGSTLFTNARAMLETEDYRRAFDVAGPELAREWHCWAFLCAQCGDRKTAAVAALKAAWVCDDAGAEEAARFFRSEALRHRAAAGPVGLPDGAAQPDSRQESLALASEAVTIIDLERRAGQLEAAGAHATQLRQWASHRTHRRAAAFELHLVGRGDQRSYSYLDVTDYAASPERWVPRSERLEPIKRWWQLWR